MDMARLLQNAFDPTQPTTGLVDHGSHMVLTLPTEYIGIEHLSPRGLVDLREPLTAPAFKMLLDGGQEGSPAPIGILAQDAYPWGSRQTGCIQVHGVWVTATATLLVPAHNVYVWTVDLAAESPLPSEVRVVLTGAFSQNFTEVLAEPRSQGIAFAVRQDRAANNWHFYALPDLVPCWRMSQVGTSLSVEHHGRTYSVGAGWHRLDTSYRMQWVIEVENRPVGLWAEWPETGPAVHPYDVAATWQESQRHWEHLLAVLPGQRASRRRELRAAAILQRCRYRGHYGHWGEANACLAMITSWASCHGYWDAAYAALGLAEFDLARAEDTLRVLFAFQRADGCVPTLSYEHMPGSTFYPQASNVSWAVLHLARRHQNWDFVRELLPCMRAVFEWYVRTQDHDGDGLIEVRYSGQVADNPPQYERYVAHVRDHTEWWNIYLPPIASVTLNSFHYADARCMAELYQGIGQPHEAAAVLARVQQIPALLERICWDAHTRYFQDYEHHMGSFNRARVLTSLLPIWAGMPLQEGRAKALIEDNLLNPGRFFGPNPFPYVAYDDPAYRADGYWSGRVWPHLTTHMLELLWQQGYQQEADAGADRVLHMMDQRETILENYYSQPDMPGGGSPDFQWSAGTYLYLVNRRYREPVL